MKNSAKERIRSIAASGESRSAAEIARLASASKAYTRFVLKVLVDCEVLRVQRSAVLGVLVYGQAEEGQG